MRLTIDDIKHRKSTKSKISILTSYDYPSAAIAQSCGIDIVLVGDSVGPSTLGYSDITMVTMNDMTHHIKAVASGAKDTFILADMPAHTFENPEQAITNAQALIKAGAQGVKIECDSTNDLNCITSVIQQSIPVCCHIGYTPQTPGLSPTVQGKTFFSCCELIELAKKCESTGCFLLLLELIPQELAGLITDIVSIPTIGIGAGNLCDGQVMVIHDILGLTNKIYKHVKVYADIKSMIYSAIKEYDTEVKQSHFPSSDKSSHLPDEVISQVKTWLDRHKAEQY